MRTQTIHADELFHLITNGMQVFTNYTQAVNYGGLCLLRSANQSLKNKIVLFHTFDKGKPREWAYVLDKTQKQISLMNSKQAEKLLRDTNEIN